MGHNFKQLFGGRAENGVIELEHPMRSKFRPRAIIFFMALCVIMGACASAQAGEFQDCSGRGNSIESLVAATRYCRNIGYSPEAVLLRPPPAYQPSPFAIASYYDTASVFMGSKYAPVAAYYYMLGSSSSVNPSVYYQSHPPIMYAPYTWR